MTEETDQPPSGEEQPEENPFEAISRAISLQQLEEAHTLLLDLPERHWESGLTQRLWAEFYLSVGDTKKALSHANKAIASRPTDATIFITLADIFMTLEKPEKAIGVLEEGVVDCPDPIPVYTKLYAIQAFLGNWDVLERQSAHLRRRFEGKPELQYLMGEASNGLNLDFAALDHYRQAMTAGYYGPFQEAHTAESFQAVAYPEASLHFCRRALQRDPHNRIALELLKMHLTAFGTLINELLVLAVERRLSLITGQQAHRASLQIIDAADIDHDAYFDIWIRHGESELDFEFFCEFYRRLAFTDIPPHALNCDFHTGLKESIDQLERANRKQLAQYFTAWFTLLYDNPIDAETQFKALEGKTSDPGLLKGIREGLRRAEDITGTYVDQVTKDTIPYSRNVSMELSKQGTGPGFGLDLVMQKVFDTLQAGPKKSMMIVGPSGAGKTTVIRQLAYQVANGPCPEDLKGTTIWQSSTSQILSGAKFIGTWQGRVLELCKKCRAEKKRILWLEDITNITSAGRALDDPTRFLDVLLPRIEAGELILIGDLLPQQAQQLAREEPSLWNQFTEIRLEEPGEAQLLQMLRDYTTRSEDYQGGPVSDEGLREAVTLASVFMPYRANPGKSMDILRQAKPQVATGVDTDDQEELKRSDVIQSFCRQTGLPTYIVDNSQKLNLPAVRSFFTERLLGQDHAVDALVGAVTLFKSRLGDPTKPIRNLFFVGPTGVGKTEAAKVLAEYLFGSPDRLIRLNMSEYSTHDAASRLLDAGQRQGMTSDSFLDKVRSTPFSVVLMDEIEKAQWNVFNLLLPLLDDGEMCDARGKPAFFHTSIVIMTSNLGSEHFTETAIGFESPETGKGSDSAVHQEVQQFFSPEFYNRFDPIIVFKPLGRDVLEKIVNREIGKVLTRRGVLDRGLVVDVDPAAIQHILKIGYDLRYGARHLKRAVEACVAVPISMLAASQTIGPDDFVRVTVVAGRCEAIIVRKQEPQTLTKSYQDLTSRESYRDLPPSDLDKRIADARARIDELKGRLSYEDIDREYRSLHEDMSRPDFWDNRETARAHMRRYTDIGRTVERVQKWQRLIERIVEMRQSDPSGRRGFNPRQLGGLLKDLESAEMELLLEDDVAAHDAFVWISAARQGDGVEKWLTDLAGVYTSWAQRRGYTWKLVAERAAGDRQYPALALHVSGMNAFGLLKNESGVHRWQFQDQRTGGKGSVPRKKHVDALVEVVPDVIDLPDSEHERLRVRMRKLPSRIRGLKERELTREVVIQDADSGEEMALLTDKSVDSGTHLQEDFFLSYAGREQAAGSTADTQQTSIVRTLETGAHSRVVDHRTQLHVTDVAGYLSGKIDRILLERLV